MPGLVTRICIRDSTGRLRRVARVTPLSDGFAVSAPYHPAQYGFLVAVDHDSRKDFQTANLKKMLRYEASDTIKLSYHRAGFMQFSKGGATNIVSGRHGAPITARDDVRSAKPRGLGIPAIPLDDPTPYPRIALQVAGLENFKEEPEGTSSLLVFEAHDLLSRDGGDSSTDKAELSFFVWQDRPGHPLRARGEWFSADVWYRGETSLGMRAVILGRGVKYPWYLGVAGWWLRETLPESGYVLVSSGWPLTWEEPHMHRSLVALYPSTIPIGSVSSLDYRPVLSR